MIKKIKLFLQKLKNLNPAKKVLSKIVLGIFVLSFFNPASVMAASSGSVVINEVAWAGSAISSTEEWIELYNTTGSPIDLTGWTISDDSGASVYALSGQINAYSFYLIEDNENVVNPNIANAIANLSLANSGDSLHLYTQANQLIDVINSNGAAWYAGDSTSKASMERIDPLTSGDSSANWNTSNGAGSITTSSDGSLIIGTPGLINSQSAVQASSSNLTLNLSTATPNLGNTLTVSADVNNVTDLFSYGIEVIYDPNILDFISATKGNFLSENGTISTSFQAGLENNIAGKLLIAEARTLTPKSGVDGSGQLFTLQFDVVQNTVSPSNITFGSGSFLADTSADLSSQFVNAQFDVSTPIQVNAVSNLQATLGAQRYSFQLTWDAPATGADSYDVYKKDPQGNYVLLNNVNANVAEDFLDNINIVPFITYEYQIITVKNGIQSLPVNISIQENRGLKADNDRSDRVDGRDLQNLANHFGENNNDPNFDALVDTNYDGEIDGIDLIDLGIDFAKVYGS